MTDIQPTKTDAADAAQAEAMDVIDALQAILSEENAAIEAGEYHRLPLTEPRKRELAARAELLLVDVARPAPEMRERTEAFRAVMDRNAALLQRMSEATGRLVDEVRRIRDRQGLGGLYTGDGVRRAAPQTKPKGVDRTI